MIFCAFFLRMQNLHIPTFNAIFAGNNYYINDIRNPTTQRTQQTGVPAYA